MAVWEFRCSLVPKDTKEPLSKICDSEGFMPQLDEDWQSNNLGTKLFDYLTLNFQVEESYCGPKFIFNTTDNSLGLCVNEQNQQVNEVSVNIDLRTKVWTDFVVNLLKITEKFQLRVYDYDSFDIYDATKESIYLHIKNSDAARFVRSPKEYFEEITKNPIN